MALAAAAGAASTTTIKSALPIPENAHSALASDDSDWRQHLASKVIPGLLGRAVSIGRSSVSMVQIGCKATTISRKHAEIVDTGSGRYRLHILGMNGVRVNDKLYSKGASVELSDGDELNFVGIRYKFRVLETDTAMPPVSPEEEEARRADKANVEAEDWWPEPACKRVLDASSSNNEPSAYQSKRARIPAENESELYHNSTDTLVGGSEAGLVSAGNKDPMAAQLMLENLPPSSPPPMHLLNDVFSSDSEGESGDALADLVDIESVTPAQLDSATAPLKLLPPVADLAGPLAKPVAPTAGVTPARTSVSKKSRTAPTPKRKSAAKENAAPAPPKQRKAQKGQDEQHKIHSSQDEQRKTPKPQDELSTRDAPKGPKEARPDDEMMASLRELLGIVDPSECLADTIDSETEEFLTTEPAKPISLASDAGLVDVVIEAMVFSARTSHTISDLLRDIARVGDDGGADCMRVWRHHLTRALFHNRCFGRVERRVKDASDRRAEDRWYYDAAKDDCSARRENFGGLVRTARRCTLRDTQYFFKQVPKLPSFRYR
ncbi:hypothetical protein H4R20_003110 [Coemansia guatemalensis]|uniref:FHA domain-containing protein n=1 Tax=Coemansia guatemalensis TaxID=2761395 RepID=A0A9W8LSY6_9FUNG|nr:hypothetical protein H4R20_003110 [Coemansia guatemalensis]